MLSVKDEQQLVERLLAGDEDAFVDLIRAYHTHMCKVAYIFISDTARAEEVVQETWLVVIDNLDSFERRSSLKTWIWGILVNKAKTQAKKEARQVALEPEAIDTTMRADAHRFDQRGHWSKPPGFWTKTPEDALNQKRILTLVSQIIETLPPLQKIVITMRDVQGFSASEVCQVLELTQSHHRVLLHRARAAIREALDAMEHAELVS